MKEIPARDDSRKLALQKQTETLIYITVVHNNIREIRQSYNENTNTQLGHNMGIPNFYFPISDPLLHKISKPTGLITCEENYRK